MTSTGNACLVRKERTGSSKLAVLKLDREQVVVGRSPTSSYIFPTPGISRTHAVLRRNEDDQWTIMDNKSVNGVFVNLMKIEAMVPVTLKPGDEVRFGVNFEKESFNYVFCTNLTAAEANLRCRRKRKHLSGDSFEIQHKTPNEDQKPKFTGDDISDVVKEKRELELRLQQMKDLLEEKVSRELALQEEMKLKEEEIKSKEGLEQQLQQMQCLLQERKKAEEALHGVMEKREQQIKIDVQRQMEEEKKCLQLEVQLKCKQDLQSLEESLKSQLISQRLSLIAEKQQVEAELQNQFDKANLELQNQLKAEKERLAKVIAAKELEQTLLEQRLKDAAARNEENQAAALNARQEVLTNFGEMLEVELQCCVCSELLIQAITLNCSHSFCKFCIVEWMKKNSSRADCPVCRAEIKCLSSSVVIDSFIDSIMEQLPPEKKNDRKAMIDERRKQSATQEIPRAVAAKFSQLSSVASTIEKAGRTNVVPIEITTSDSDDESYDESGSDNEDEDGVAYYGGYGRCFTCGARGHWSNACPNR